MHKGQNRGRLKGGSVKKRPQETFSLQSPNFPRSWMPCSLLTDCPSETLLLVRVSSCILMYIVSSPCLSYVSLFTAGFQQTCYSWEAHVCCMPALCTCVVCITRKTLQCAAPFTQSAFSMTTTSLVVHRTYQITLSMLASRNWDTFGSVENQIVEHA